MLPDKYIAIIASAGRTGTGFFGDHLSEVVENSFSVHEPDIFKFRPSETLQQLKIFGPKQLFYEKIFKDLGIRQISEKNINSDQIDPETLDKIETLRLKYYSSISESLIIESYYAWYGLIEEAYESFRNVKVVSVIRDPRTWIRSNVNWETYYGNRDLSTRMGFQRLNPVLLGDQRYAQKWESMSLIEKLAWVWLTIYSEIQRQEQKGNTTLYKYEDLFLGEDRKELKLFLNEITSWPDRKFEYDIPETFLKTKSNTNISYDFPKWDEWREGDQEKVLSICGDLMKKYGYE